jgi:hypothetical protein
MKVQLINVSPSGAAPLSSGLPQCGPQRYADVNTEIYRLDY